MPGELTVIALAREVARGFVAGIALALSVEQAFHWRAAVRATARTAACSTRPSTVRPPPTGALTVAPRTAPLTVDDFADLMARQLRVRARALGRRPDDHRKDCA